MAVDLNTYRARVGIFDQRRPIRIKKQKLLCNPTNLQLSKEFKYLYLVIQAYLSVITYQGVHLPKSNIIINITHKHNKLLLLFLILILPSLILLSGDVHTNPGPNIMHEIPCYFLNAQSIKNVKNAQGKLIEFKQLLYTINPYILGVSETWLNNEIGDGEIVSEDEFKLHRKDRDEKKGGGVLLLVHAGIKSERRKKYESKRKAHNEIIVVEVEPSSGTKFVIITAYRSQKDPFDKFLHNFETVLTNCANANLNNILVIGDFNYSDITWNTALDTKLPPPCRNLLETFDRFGLKQLNTHPSRKNNNNILDLILSNNPTTNSFL